MHLILQRSHHFSFCRRITYILDVTIATTMEERALINEHKFGDNPLFKVPEVDANRELATSAFERSDNRSLLRASDAPKLLADVAAALFHTARSRLGYIVIVNDALTGTRILCPDIYQLMEAETSITTAFDELDRDVQNALAFTIGREQVFAPDTTDHTNEVAPAHWADHHRWTGTR